MSCIFLIYVFGKRSCLNQHIKSVIFKHPCLLANKLHLVMCYHCPLLLFYSASTGLVSNCSLHVANGAMLHMKNFTGCWARETLIREGPGDWTTRRYTLTDNTLTTHTTSYFRHKYSTWQGKDEFPCSFNVNCGKGSWKTEEQKHTGHYFTFISCVIIRRSRSISDSTTSQ